MRLLTTSGPARLKFRFIRLRSPTSCGVAVFSANVLSRSRQPDILRGSSRRLPFRIRGWRFVDPRNIVAPVVSPTRAERSVPLKAIVAQLNYNLFDIELGTQQ